MIDSITSFRGSPNWQTPMNLCQFLQNQEIILYHENKMSKIFHRKENDPLPAAAASWAPNPGHAKARPSCRRRSRHQRSCVMPEGSTCVRSAWRRDWQRLERLACCGSGVGDLSSWCRGVSGWRRPRREDLNLSTWHDGSGAPVGGVSGGTVKRLGRSGVYVWMATGTLPTGGGFTNPPRLWSVAGMKLNPHSSPTGTMYPRAHPCLPAKS